MSDRFEYDIFLSHSSKDKPAVRKLATRLRQDGVRVWFDEWNIEPGDSIPLKVEQGLEDSQALVLVMSRNAFGSDWVDLERHTAMFRDPTNKTRRFIPILLDDVPIKGVLSQFAYIDWRNEDVEQYQKLVAMFPRPHLKKQENGPSLLVDSEEDSLAEYFTNREDLRQHLELTAASLEPLKKRVCNIQGGVGTGKSAVLRMLYLYCKKNRIPVALISGRRRCTEIEILRQLAYGLAQIGLNLAGFNVLSQEFEEAGVAVARVVADLSAGTPPPEPVQDIGPVSKLLSGLQMSGRTALSRNPVTILTDEFLRGVNTFALERRIVLLLDHHEEIVNVDEWLCDWLRRLSSRVLAVIAGEQMLVGAEWDNIWPDWHAHVYVERLEALSGADKRLLVQRLYTTMCGRKPDSAEVNEIVVSGGDTPLSLELEVLMRYWGYRGHRETTPDQLESIVKALLRGTPPESLPIIEAAAVLRSPDREVLRAIIGSEQADRQAEHLVPLRLLLTRSNTLRAVMNGYLKGRHRERFQALHQKASEYYRLRAAQFDALKPWIPEDREQRQRAELECLYHEYQLAESRGMEEFRRLFESCFIERWELDFCRAAINEAEGCVLETTNRRWLRLYGVLLDIRSGKDLDDSRRILEELHAEQSNDGELQTCILESLATLHWLQDSTEAAKHIYEEALESCASLPKDLPRQAGITIGLGRLYKRTGKAEDILLRARDTISDQPTQALLERELGDALRLQGRFREADKLLTASIATYEQLHMDFEQAHSLRMRAMLLVYTGKLREAERLFQRSRTLFEQCAKGPLRMYESVWITMGLGDVALGRRNFTKALRLYSEALQCCEGSEFETSVLQGCLADLYCAKGEWDRSIDCANLSLDVRKKHGDKFGIAWEDYTKGLALIGKGLMDDALGCLGEGLGMSEEYGSAFLQSRLTLGLCEMHYRVGDIGALETAAIRVQSWAEQFGYFDHSARVHILKGLLDLSVASKRSQERQVLNRVGERLARGLADALKFNIIVLDRLAQDVLESPVWNALQAAEKRQLVQILEDHWSANPTLPEAERQERALEYGYAQTEPMREAFRATLGN